MNRITVIRPVLQLIRTYYTTRALLYVRTVHGHCLHDHAPAAVAIKQLKKPEPVRRCTYSGSLWLLLPPLLLSLACAAGRCSWSTAASQRQHRMRHGSSDAAVDDREQRAGPPGQVPAGRPQQQQPRLLPPLRSAQELVSGTYAYDEPELEPQRELLRPSHSQGAVPTGASAAGAAAAARWNDAIEAHVLSVRHHSILSKLRGAARGSDTQIPPGHDRQRHVESRSSRERPRQQQCQAESPRDGLRRGAREANRDVWAPLSALLWTPVGSKGAATSHQLTSVAQVFVAVHGIFVLVGLWNFYACFILHWEHRVTWGFLGIFSLSTCIMLWATVTACHPERGKLPQMCSFFPFDDADIKGHRSSRRRFAIGGALFMTGMAMQLAYWLMLVISGSQVGFGAETRFVTNTYGGHGGTPLVVGLIFLEVLCTVVILPCILLFICSLSAASRIAATGADRLVNMVDAVDNDEEVRYRLLLLYPGAESTCDGLVVYH